MGATFSTLLVATFLRESSGTYRRRPAAGDASLPWNNTPCSRAEVTWRYAHEGPKSLCYGLLVNQTTEQRG